MTRGTGSLPGDLPEVFIGCSVEGLPVAKAIQNNLQFMGRVSIWSQGQFELGRPTLQNLTTAARKFDFAIFILFPDDVTESRGRGLASPRDNTIFEAGLFMGILGRNRVFLVVPRNIQVKLPTDLAGTVIAQYDSPRDDRWDAALGPASNQIETAIRRRGLRGRSTHGPTRSCGPQHVFSSLKQASHAITEACRKASDIKVLANKGVVFLGTDDSLISTAEIHLFTRLRKLRVLLMSPESRWISSHSTADGRTVKGLISLRKHESLETFLNEIRVSHQFVENGFREFAKILSNTRSGVRYFTGEPFWRMVMTEETAFVSNYADTSVSQVRDLPVHRFDNVPGSFYTAFHRHFNSIWHNQSEPGRSLDTGVDFAVSAGGIVYADDAERRHILLLKRHDGAWVLPKGHKKLTDTSLEETALREVAEESGIRASSLQVEESLDTYTDSTFDFQGERKVVTIFSIRYLGSGLPSLTPDADHAEAHWWPIAESVPEMLYPYQSTLVAEFIDHHRSLS
jgi:8-oxo-dGTP pyrophosphatase MutT (NUDIX family)